MGILSWIVAGAIAGWLTGVALRGHGFGLLGNLLVGVAGGLVGGWLAGTLLHLSDIVNAANFTSILVAFLGAVVLMLVIRLLRGR